MPTSALVGLGGDIRTAGAVPVGGWVIPVLDPFDADVVWREEVLGAEAVITSTSLLRRWSRGGRALHHILDPISGLPTRHRAWWRSWRAGRRRGGPRGWPRR